MRLALVLIVTTLALGCGKKTPTQSELEAIKTEACACKDKACAEKIDKRMNDLTANLDEKDLDEKTMGIMLEIAGCVTAHGVE